MAAFVPDQGYIKRNEGYLFAFWGVGNIGNPFTSASGWSLGTSEQAELLVTSKYKLEKWRDDYDP